MSLASGLAAVAAPRALIDSVSRVLRGGSWNNSPQNLRSANRNRNQPDNRNNNLGFRLASTIFARAEGITVPSGVHFSSRVDHDEHGRGPRRDGRSKPA